VSHKPRVLVVEDEPTIAEAIAARLEAEGFAVDQVHDGLAALERAAAWNPELVVLDVMLPGLDGHEVCRRLQADRPVPVLMLTARDDEIDLLVGLGIGADDYMTKPFSPKELVARVRTILRRTAAAAAGDGVVRVGDLVVDGPRMRVSAGQRHLELTATEFQLLATLARSPGRVFTRAQLLDAVHGVAFESYERAIDAHVKNIRHKLEPDPRRPRYVLTVYGVGYKCADA